MRSADLKRGGGRVRPFVSERKTPNGLSQSVAMIGAGSESQIVRHRLGDGSGESSRVACKWIPIGSPISAISASVGACRSCSSRGEARTRSRREGFESRTWDQTPTSSVFLRCRSGNSTIDGFHPKESSVARPAIVFAVDYAVARNQWWRQTCLRRGCLAAVGGANHSKLEPASRIP
jgi:hypothetical protein